MAQLSIFRFYVWSMLSREEHFNSIQEEYKEAFLLRVLFPPHSPSGPIKVNFVTCSLKRRRRIGRNFCAAIRIPDPSVR